MPERAPKQLPKRPDLSKALPAEEFLRWYWLKSELVQACRELGLGSSSSKLELIARIHACLAGKPAPAPAQRTHAGTMPSHFSLNTRIGPGWRCNPALGAFLRAHAGPGFRFNAAVRAFVHTQVGKRVQDVIACYHASQRSAKPALPKQLEYNRFQQAFARQHPGASREQMLQAWRKHCAQPSDERAQWLEQD